MGHLDKIPIISEKKVTYSGIYDINSVYGFLSGFLENSRHYDLSEKDYEEKKDGDVREIKVKCEAVQEFTDYYKVIIKFGLSMTGKNITIETPEGKKINRVNGKATLIINSYIEADWQHKRGQTPFTKFLDKVYTKYVGQSEMEKCAFSSVMDVNELMGRFKQQMNTTN